MCASSDVTGSTLRLATSTSTRGFGARVARHWLAGMATFGALGAVAPAIARAEGSSAAPSQPTADEARAEALFQQAREKATRRDFAAACPLFEQSYRIAGGGGTAQNLATCYEDLGKLALAYNAFLELRRVSLEAGRQDRVKLADEHLAKLEPRLSRLAIRAPDGPRLEELEVAIDGDVYGERAWEAGLVLDVGPHRIRVSAKGKKSLELNKTITREGVRETLALPQLEDAVKVPTVDPLLRDALESRRSMRTVGYVVGGVGLATLVAGGVFGVLTFTTEASARDACTDTTPGKSLSNVSGNDPRLFFDAAGHCYAATPTRANPYLDESNRLHERARSFGTLSTILVPLGLAGIAGGAYILWKTASADPRADLPGKTRTARAPRVLPTFLPTMGGLVIEGDLP
jgi:hypothetical protein